MCWVHWWNTTRIHSELDYHTPQEIDNHYWAANPATLIPAVLKQNPGRFSRHLHATTGITAPKLIDELIDLQEVDITLPDGHTHTAHPNIDKETQQILNLLGHLTFRSQVKGVFRFFS